MLPRRETIGAALLLGVICLAGCKQEGAKQRGNSPSAASPVATRRGEQLFKERCAQCHPDGGNTINPKKTLHAGVLADYGIKTAADVALVLRNPGPGMPRFDEGTIPEQDAILIGEYVLTSFR
jgi:cytochrome c6